MYKLILSIGFLLASFAPAEGKETGTEQIFRLIYNQDYSNAGKLLQLHRDSTDAIHFCVLEIDLSYWRNVTGTDNPDYEAFEKTLEKYASIQASSQQQKVIRLITLSYQLRYQLKKYQLLRAIITRKKTVALFNELQDQTGKLSRDQQLLFKLYNALIVYFDNFLKPFFISEKNNEMERAIAEMGELSNSEQLMIRTLSSYFLGKIYLKYEKQPEQGAVLFKWLTSEYPANKRFEELLTECRKK